MAVLVYELTGALTLKAEQYGLTNQFKKICCFSSFNIAEAAEEIIGEFDHFLDMLLVHHMSLKLN